ncbi:MAG: hypothetical protein ACRD1C_10370 [Terriglobales bacterium]
MNKFTALEIANLLAAHSGEPMDYVAIVTLLNTVAGGHYQERHSEQDIRVALDSMLRDGRIESVPAGSNPGACTFRLANR